MERFDPEENSWTMMPSMTKVSLFSFYSVRLFFKLDPEPAPASIWPKKGAAPAPQPWYLPIGILTNVVLFLSLKIEECNRRNIFVSTQGNKLPL